MYNQMSNQSFLSIIPSSIINPNGFRVSQPESQSQSTGLTEFIAWLNDCHRHDYEQPPRDLYQGLLLKGGPKIFLQAEKVEFERCGPDNILSRVKQQLRVNAPPMLDFEYEKTPDEILLVYLASAALDRCITPLLPYSGQGALLTRFNLMVFESIYSIHFRMEHHRLYIAAWAGLPLRLKSWYSFQEARDLFISSAPGDPENFQSIVDRVSIYDVFDNLQDISIQNFKYLYTKYRDRINVDLKTLPQDFCHYIISTDPGSFRPELMANPNINDWCSILPYIPIEDIVSATLEYNADLPLKWVEMQNDDNTKQPLT